MRGVRVNSPELQRVWKKIRADAYAKKLEQVEKSPRSGVWKMGISKNGVQNDNEWEGQRKFDGLEINPGRPYWDGLDIRGTVE